jgi:Zn-dependent protease
LSTAAFINGFLATFNLLPFSIIDGKKVFDWNKIIWFVFFFISISFILIVSYNI